MFSACFVQIQWSLKDMWGRCCMWASDLHYTVLLHLPVAAVDWVGKVASLTVTAVSRMMCPWTVTRYPLCIILLVKVLGTMCTFVSWRSLKCGCVERIVTCSFLGFCMLLHKFSNAVNMLQYWRYTMQKCQLLQLCMQAIYYYNNTFVYVISVQMLNARYRSDWTWTMFTLHLAFSCQ
jgi:hypothetical protein